MLKSCHITHPVSWSAVWLACWMKMTHYTDPYVTHRDQKPSYSKINCSGFSLQYHHYNNNNNNNNNNWFERRDSICFTISSLRCKLSPTCTLKWPGLNCVQIMCNTGTAHHMQHVVCHLVRRDSSAIKVESLNHIDFSFILLAETINQWRRGG